MSHTFHITPAKLTLADLQQALAPGVQLALSEESIGKVNTCRAFLDKQLVESDDLHYGINTGFGSLCNIRINKDEVEALQENLVQSHACGTGSHVPQDIVRLMLLLKIHGLALGYSGITLDTLQRLVQHYNEGVYPVIYTQGSLGASGDLAPLAHLSLPLIGLGEVWYQGEIRPSAEVLQQLGWQPLKLKAKEGLALINGTQFMGAYGCYVLLKAKHAAQLMDLVAAMSLDAFDARTTPFHEMIQTLRPYAGQKETAANILRYLQGSDIAQSKKNYVQDPYSFRCIPQVHGAAKDVIAHVASVFETEINSVTDNPLIIPETGEILSGGNFHGQPLAMALDYLGIALADLSSIAERRIYQLVSGHRGLPPFLTEHSGLHSGMMIPQYTAASLVSRNKQLATPASVDTITSSAGQEDHVSMGANGAVKTLQILENLETVIAIELLVAAQALDLRKPAKTSPYLQNIIDQYRQTVPYLGKDRELYRDIQASLLFIGELQLPA